MTPGETKAYGRADAQPTAGRWKLGKTLAAIFVVAVLCNYPWELAQAPLYVGMQSFRSAWWHCFVASLGDGLILWCIFVVGWVVRQRQEWFVHPGVRGYVVMLGAGFVISIAVEWMAVHVTGRWMYAARMPLMPGLDVGIVPVMQMLVLPPLIFRFVAMWRGRTLAHADLRSTRV